VIGLAGAIVRFVTDEPSAPDGPLIEQAQVIRTQIETIRAILVEAGRRRLDPEEKAAIAELARACAELTDAARSLLRPR
jgi:hypothetical protein